MSERTVSKPKLTAAMRTQLRRAKTAAQTKYGFGGSLKKKQPKPITLRNFEKSAT